MVRPISTNMSYCPINSINYFMKELRLRYSVVQSISVAGVISGTKACEKISPRSSQPASINFEQREVITYWRPRDLLAASLLLRKCQCVSFLHLALLQAISVSASLSKYTWHSPSKWAMVGIRLSF